MSREPKTVTIDRDFLEWALAAIGDESGGCPFDPTQPEDPDHHGPEFAAALFDALVREVAHRQPGESRPGLVLGLLLRGVFRASRHGMSERLVITDKFRDEHERAMRDHMLEGPKDHRCDDLCSDSILDRMAGKKPINEYPLRPAPAYLDVPGTIPTDAIDAIKTLPHITVEKMLGLWVSLDQVVHLLNGWITPATEPRSLSEPLDDESVPPALAAWFNERAAAIRDVAAHRASPPEYPGLALVPVPALDRLARYVELPRPGELRRGSGSLDADRLGYAMDLVDEEDMRVGVVGRGRKVDRIIAQYARLATDPSAPEQTDE